MAFSVEEQYLLELINRGRLDPLGEAKRMGIDLNQGLTPGRIDGSAKQVLAPNALLEQAAALHSQWMLNTDIFSHTGAGGTDPGQRITAVGYSWNTYGENIAYVGTTGSIVLKQAIEDINTNLFLSSGHRVNTMNGAFREVGLGAEAGQFTKNGTTFNAEMVTENFATSGSARFVTGVVYSDADADRFYSMGEGTSGAVFTLGAASTSSSAAGGYALSVGTAQSVAITGTLGALTFAVTLDMSGGNVKLDLVDRNTLFTSGSMILGSGVNAARLLGVADLNLAGNGAANRLLGNAGDNVLTGGAGRDALTGGLGRDVLSGDGGKDRLTGGLQADQFVFRAGMGEDTVTDYKHRQGDGLQLDDALWGGGLTATQVVSQFASVQTGEVLFNFGAGNLLHLTGVTTLVGLASDIALI